MSTKQTTLRALLRDCTAQFRKAGLHYGHGTHNAAEEASWLFCHVLDVPWDRLAAALDNEPSAKERLRITALCQRRLIEHIPMAYLIKEAWLGEHRFYVDQRTIVPRSFIAELLHESLSPWVRLPGRITNVLDMCTGSGCLAILAALTFPKAAVDAADISRAALKVAQRNVSDYRLQSRVTLLKSDIFSGDGFGQYD